MSGRLTLTFGLNRTVGTTGESVRRELGVENHMLTLTKTRIL